MYIYHYHPETGEYLHSGRADPDPLDKDNWLIPAHATTAAAPATGEHETAVWRDGAWAVVADYRGETWYQPDGTPVIIELLGQMPEPDWTAEPPPPPPPPESSPYELLAASDAEMARVVEDIWDALVAKGLLAETDLPQAARDKTAQRKALRARL